MKNRLQIVHHDTLFATREAALQYIKDNAVIQRPSLYAEPIVVKYGTEDNINIILGIGANGDGVTQAFSNRYFLIDTAKLESDIAELAEIVKNNEASCAAVKAMVQKIIIAGGFNEDGTYKVDSSDMILSGATSLSNADKLLSQTLQSIIGLVNLTTVNTNTIEIVSTQDKVSGTTISANVRIPKKLVDGSKVIDNIIKANEEGVFANVQLLYNSLTGELKFTNGINESVMQLPLDTFVESGFYDKNTEELVLILNRNIDIIEGSATTQTNQVRISMTDLVEEWTVGRNSDSPIILTRERNINGQDVLYGNVALHPVQDNILIVRGGGLYVKGTADNISYSGTTTVKQQIDSMMLSVKDTPTIDLTLTPTSTGTTIQADVNIVSDVAGNIIFKKTGGLYANVDLDYEPTSGVLTFTNGVGDPKTFKLTMESFLKRGYYDSAAEELVLIFATQGGTSESEVRIPVYSLIEEWNVGRRPNSAVILEKVRTTSGGADILYGDVALSNASDSILENVNGSLYVKGTADNIKYNSTQTVADKIDQITGDAATTGSFAAAIAVESERAKAAELGNTRAIAAETERAKNVELFNTNAITAETTRAKEAEQVIATAVETETARAQHAEQVNSTAISNEVNRATSAEETISHQLDNEIIRAKAAEEANATAISNEVTRASQAEGTLTATLAEESSRAKLAEQANAGAISQETTRAKAAESHLETLVTNNGILVSGVTNDLRALSQYTVESVNSLSAYTTSVITIASDDATVKANTAKTEAIASSNQYTDATEASLRTVISTAQRDAQDYADTKDVDLKNAIDTEINGLKAKTLIATGDNAIILTSGKDSNGNLTLNGKIELATGSNNLISKVGDGLLAYVDLTYDNGKLTLSGNNGFTKSVDVAINGLIENVTRVGNSLVFTFKNADGSTTQITIDLTDLISDWEPISNYVVGGKQISVDLVKLAPTSGDSKSKLYGDVKMYDGDGHTVISSPTHNILAKETSTGKLFVEGTSSNIMHNGTMLDRVIDNISGSSTEAIDKSIISGSFSKADSELTLFAKDGSTVIIPGIEAGGSVTGGTVSSDGHILTLNNSDGTMVNISLTNVINAAIQAAAPNYTAINTDSCITTIDNVARTIKVEVATIDCGEY